MIACGGGDSTQWRAAISWLHISLQTSVQSLGSPPYAANAHQRDPCSAFVASSLKLYQDRPTVNKICIWTEGNSGCWRRWSLGSFHWSYITLSILLCGLQWILIPPYQHSNNGDYHQYGHLNVLAQSQQYSYGGIDDDFVG